MFVVMHANDQLLPNKPSGYRKKKKKATPSHHQQTVSAVVGEPCAIQVAAAQCLDIGQQSASHHTSVGCTNGGFLPACKVVSQNRRMPT